MINVFDQYLTPKANHVLRIRIIIHEYAFELTTTLKDE